MEREDKGRKQPEIIEERSPFPVGRSVVKKVLNEIIKDPVGVMEEEKEILESQNPRINNFLYSSILAGDQERKEAFLWTHRILREQAKRNGGRLIEVQKSVAEKFFWELQYGEFDPKPSEQLRNEEPNIAMAIKEITKYRVYAGPSYFASLVMVAMVKRATEAKNKI